MKRVNMYQTFEVAQYKSTECPIRNTRLNFFQFIYVLSGQGIYRLNGANIPFAGEDLFLITPHDRHEFDLAGECEFLVIQFNQQYIKDYQWNYIDHIECILFHSSHLHGSIIVSQKDKVIVKSLINSLIEIINPDNIYDEDLMRNLINAIIVLSARNIASFQPKRINGNNASKKILEILEYIQFNIRQPSMLKVNVMADNFGLSANYLGKFFKRECGETLQDYISAYRLRLIEHRLRFGDSRIGEIVDEFGFTDESHINKFFRKFRNMSLKDYRESYHHQLQDAS